LVHDLQKGPIRVALRRQETIVRIFHVIGGQLAPVDLRLVLPPDALSEAEDVNRISHAIPGLREVAVEGLRARDDGRPGLDHDQSAIREREWHHRRVGGRLVGIEVSGRPRDAYAEGASAIWLLGFLRRRISVRETFARPETKCARGCRSAAQLEQVAAGHWLRPGT